MSVPEILRDPQLMVALAALSIIAEVILAGALWSPKWRRPAVVLGISLHLGMILLLGAVFQVAIFAAATLALYVLFFDDSNPPVRTLTGSREAAPAGASVV